MAANKQISPTVKPKPGGKVLDFTTQASEPAKELALPPISHIKPPKMDHMSTKIRWYLGLGYKVKEVSDFLGVRYQQVRNVGVQTPKRAAREDVPPYVYDLWEIDDDLEAMEAHALEENMAAQRNEDRKAKRDLKKDQRRKEHNSHVKRVGNVSSATHGQDEDEGNDDD